MEHKNRTPPSKCLFFINPPDLYGACLKKNRIIIRPSLKGLCLFPLVCRKISFFSLIENNQVLYYEQRSLEAQKNVPAVIKN